MASTMDKNTTFAKYSSYTQLKKIKVQHTWTIADFKLRPEQTGTALYSPTFSAVGPKWRLKFYPNGNQEAAKDYLSLYLESCNKQEVTAHFKFSILNVQKQETNVSDLQTTHKFAPNGYWGWNKFIQRSILFNNKNNLLADDKLMIFCEINISGDSVSTSDQSNVLPINESQQMVLENLGDLLEKEEFFDVTLVVGDRELKAHKAILCARSDVFATMFKNNMKEQKSNRVDITDIDYNVLKEMLKFVYTGKSPNLIDMTEDLLAAAEKYCLGNLKVICEMELCAKLSVEKAAETLILADTYNAAHLKTHTLNFINAQATDVMETVGWINVEENHPHLLGEAYRAIAKLLPRYE